MKNYQAEVCYQNRSQRLRLLFISSPLGTGHYLWPGGGHRREAFSRPSILMTNHAITLIYFYNLTSISIPTNMCVTNIKSFYKF